MTSGQTEDARRLAHRAISYRPAMTPAMREPVIKPAMMVAPPGSAGHHVPVTRAMVGLTSHHGPVDRADSGIGGGSASGSSPTTSLDMVSRDVGGLSIQVRNIVCYQIRIIAPHAHQITLIYFSHVCIFMSVVGMDAIFILRFGVKYSRSRGLHVCLDITIFISFVCTKVDCVGSRSWANKSSS